MPLTETSRTMHMDSTAGPGAPFTPQPIPPSTGIDPFDREMQAREDARDDGRFPPQLAGLMAENRELRGEIERLRAEREKLAETQGRMMEVLDCKSPERLVHDLRNVLNERDLYRALADTLPE